MGDLRKKFYEAVKELFPAATPVYPNPCYSLIGHFLPDEIKEGFDIIKVNSLDFLDIVDDEYRDSLSKLIQEPKTDYYAPVTGGYVAKVDTGGEVSILESITKFFSSFLGKISLKGNVEKVRSISIDFGSPYSRIVEDTEIQRLGRIRIHHNALSYYKDRSIYLINAAVFTKELLFSFYDATGMKIDVDIEPVVTGGFKYEKLDKGLLKITAGDKCAEGFAIAIEAIKLEERDGAFVYEPRRLFKATERKALTNDIPAYVLAIEFE